MPRFKEVVAAMSSNDFVDFLNYTLIFEGAEQKQEGENAAEYSEQKDGGKTNNK